MKFHMSDDGSIGYEAGDTQQDLGVWLTFDLGRNYFGCLNALASVADATSGAEPSVHYEGNGYDLEFQPSQVVITHKFLDRFSTYPLSEARKAIEEFWRFITGIPDNPVATRVYRPDLPEPLAYLLLWESQWRRPHPYRGRIEGIPAQGPD
jgi:hypothetical protein